MWIDLTITRETEDESKDIEVQVWVSEGVPSHYAGDDDHNAILLTETEREQVRDLWERAE